jgi:hypothetical protein
MNWLFLLIVGIILVVVAYYLPAPPAVPPPLKTILLIIGWICVIVGALLFVAFLLGVPFVLAR